MRSRSVPYDSLHTVSWAEWARVRGLYYTDLRDERYECVPWVFLMVVWIQWVGLSDLGWGVYSYTDLRDERYECVPGVFLMIVWIQWVGLSELGWGVYSYTDLRDERYECVPGVFLMIVCIQWVGLSELGWGVYIILTCGTRGMNAFPECSLW